MDPGPGTSSDGSFLSPRKKRPKRALSVTEKIMVQNVYKYVFNEQSSEIESAKVSECASKTADILGISQRVVFTTLKEHKENKDFKAPEKPGPKHNFKDKLDDFTLSAIRRKVHGIYAKNEAPTIKKTSIESQAQASTSAVRQTSTYTEGDDTELNSDDDITDDADDDDADDDGGGHCEAQSGRDGERMKQVDRHADSEGNTLNCNVCRKDIVGFRYVCMQCSSVELCSACEARSAHAEHYVLRVPPTRPNWEVVQIIQRVREEIAQSFGQQPEPQMDIAIKEEPMPDPIKEDPEPDPDSRPHTSNILEQSVLQLVKEEEEWGETSVYSHSGGQDPTLSTPKVAVPAVSAVPTTRPVAPAAPPEPRARKRPVIEIQSGVITMPPHSRTHTHTHTKKPALKVREVSRDVPAPPAGSFEVFTHHTHDRDTHTLDTKHQPPNPKARKKTPKDSTK